MALHLRLFTRKAIIGTALAAGMFFSLAGLAGPAGAAVNGTIESASAATSCNSANRTMTFGVSIMLNAAYSNGAPVAWRFRYYQVNSAGARTSAFYGGNWIGAHSVDTWSAPGGVLMNNAVTLNGGSVVWAGRLDAQVEIGVWTGSGYVYTGWMDINSYTNYYPGFGVPSTNSFCMTAW
jgi:hypothetical protein